MARPGLRNKNAALLPSSPYVPIVHKGGMGVRMLVRVVGYLGAILAVLEVVLRGPFNFVGHGGGLRGGAEGSSKAFQLPKHTGKCLGLQGGTDPLIPDNRIVPVWAVEPAKCQLYTPPTPYIGVLMMAMVGFPNQGSCTNYLTCETTGPYVPLARQYGLDWPPFGFTMVGTARLENFRAAIEEVNRNGIPGAIMELGVWRGGAMIMATAVQKEYRSMGGSIPRDMYVLDAFELIPPGNYGSFLFNKEVDVMENFKLFNMLDSNVRFVKGLFKDTVPLIAKDPKVGDIAVLRVDGNFYDSYQDSLYYMYAKVPVGGIVIFDDVMSHPPVMQAWLDFKADQGLPEELNRIDVHSAWFRKSKQVVVDMSKMRPPRDVNVKIR